MPYASRAQQRAMHAKAERGEISKATVEEFDEATKKKGFGKLPEHKEAKAHPNHGAQVDENYRHPQHGAKGSHETGKPDCSEGPGERRKGSRA